MSNELTRLGGVVDVVMGQAPPGDQCNSVGDGTVFVKAGEFGIKNPLVREWTTKPLKFARINDTLLCVVGATCGKTNLASFDCAIGRSVAAVRPNTKKIDEDFLYYFLSTQVQRMRDRSQGAAQGVITKEMIFDIELSLPPLAEQRRIAAVLDKAEEIKRKREAAIAKLDQLAQSVFVEMFGDPRDNEKNFPRVKIRELVDDFRGGAALKPTDFVDAGFPILHKGAIKKNGNVIIDSAKKTFSTREYAANKPTSIIDRDYLAVTLRDLVPSGPSIGLVASMEHGHYDRYLLAQGAYGFKVDKSKLGPEYFIQLSNMPNFRHVLRQHAVGSTQIHIRTPVYLDINIPLPPIYLQNKFCEWMRKHRSIREKLLTSIESNTTLSVALQHQAFTTGFET